MNAVVNDFIAVNTIFLLQVRIKSRLDVLHDGLPATKKKKRSDIHNVGSERTFDMPIIVVDKIAETRSVDDSQMQTDTVFLDVCEESK
jgi:hypothetical protein